MKTHRYLRLAVLAVAAVLAAWLLPYGLNAERYRHAVQTRLEQALGRTVAFGSIDFRLVPRPGFSLHDVVVHERPEFGSEPFARVDEVDCDLAMGSLLRGRLSLKRLTLKGATISLVRDRLGRWNVEPARAATAPAPHAAEPSAAGLTVEVDDARLNFKLGSETKPFAVTDVDGAVSFNPSRGEARFDLAGSPLRTDLGLPSPGRVRFSGKLTLPPGDPGALDATLSTRGALLYDWIPLVSGRNPQIYGLADAAIRFTGSLRLVNVSARIRVTQLRRWEALPPSGSFPVVIDVQGSLNRNNGEAVVNALQAQFGQSRLAVTGAIVGVGARPVFNLSVAVDRSRWDDFLSLSSRLAGWPRPNETGMLAGIVNASVGIAGPWPALEYSGSMSLRSGILVVRGVRAPLSPVELRFSGRRIDLLPVTVTAEPRLQVTARAWIQLPPAATVPPRRHGTQRLAREAKRSAGPGYQVSLSAGPASAHQWVILARTLGVGYSRDVDARGLASASLILAHTGWPPSLPGVSAQGEIQDTSLVLPGLAKPVEIRDARLSYNDGAFVANPVDASFGGAVFSGHLEHLGGRSHVWTFEAQSPRLDLAEAATWLETFARRPALPWFAHIPGLNTLAERRAAGSDLFTALHASGNFSTPALTYGSTTLRNVSARIEISQRVLRIMKSHFRVSSGRGQSTAEINLRSGVPQLAAEFSLHGLRLENWRPHLPPELAELRGSMALEGRLTAQGRSRDQLRSSLEGRLKLRLTNVDPGRFDPVRAAARAAAWGELPLSHIPSTLRSADLALTVRNREFTLAPVSFELGTTVFHLDGNVGFDGSARLASTVDFNHLNRHSSEDRDPVSNQRAHFELTGPLDDLRATPTESIATQSP